MRTTQPALVRIVIRTAACALLLGSQSRIAGAQQAEPAPAPAQAREATPFEEIVVTAQRREQRLQDVGISVTPLSEEMLEDLNVNTATDIVRAVPSLKMNAYSSSQVVFNVLGVAQNSYGDEQEPPQHRVDLPRRQRPGPAVDLGVRVRGVGRVPRQEQAHEERDGGGGQHSWRVGRPPQRPLYPVAV